MTRFRTRWVVIVFVAVGALLALWLIVRDLDDSGDEPDQNGTLANTLASSTPR